MQNILLLTPAYSIQPNTTNRCQLVLHSILYFLFILFCHFYLRGLDSVSRVWDIRTSSSIMVLQGHSGPIASVVFSPNGFHVATASEDHSIHVWDMRSIRRIHNIPAHTGLVSSIAYNPDAS